MPELTAKLVTHIDGELLECPIWLGNGMLSFVDIPSGQIFRLSNSSQLTVNAVGQPVGAVIPGATDDLWFAARDGIGRMEADGARIIVPIEIGDPGNQMNDAQVDPAGRIWAGTTAVDESPGAGTLYSIDADFTVTAMITGTTISNGLGWSPDARTMYYIDSPTLTVNRYHYDLAMGIPSDPRPLVDLLERDGLPDGMTVDREGRVWVAFWGGGAVRCYSAAGILLMTVRVPTPNVTSCTFGGSDFRTLYITTAADAESGTSGAIYSCRPGATGRPAFRFRPR